MSRRPLMANVAEFLFLLAHIARDARMQAERPEFRNAGPSDVNPDAHGKMNPPSRGAWNDLSGIILVASISIS